MPLKFTKCVIPSLLSKQHKIHGGKDLTMYSAEIDDGSTLTPSMFVRVMGAVEPIDERGTLKGHVTVSIGPKQGPPVRRPTDHECQEAIALFPELALTENNCGAEFTMVRNFWEE